MEYAGTALWVGITNYVLTTIGVKLSGFDPTQRADEHWTVVARRCWPAKKGVLLVQKWVPLVVGTLVFLRTQSIVLALLLASSAFVGGMFAGHLDRRISWSMYLSRMAMTTVRTKLWILIIAGVAPFCSDVFDTRTILVLVCGGLLLVLYHRDGIYLLDRFLSLRAPADLKRRVGQVAARMEHPPPAVHVLRFSLPIACAYPYSNAIAISRSALEHLNDSQIEAVVAHEIGHLRDSGLSSGLLPYYALPLIVWAAYRPLMAQYGPDGYLMMGAGSLIVHVLVGRLLTAGRAPQNSERIVDEEACRHSSPAALAGALERMHREELVPAVLEKEDSPHHPNLYDRMLRCGYSPNYERPDAPSANLRGLVLACPLVGTSLLIVALL